MPYPNEHACRLNNPDKYDRIRRVNNNQRSDGKGIDVLYGISGNKTEIQALRYDKKIWTREQANAHCRGRGGNFEGAIE